MKESKEYSLDHHTRKVVKLIAWLVFWGFLLNGGCHYSYHHHSDIQEIMRG